MIECGLCMIIKKKVRKIISCKSKILIFYYILSSCPLNIYTCQITVASI